VYINNIPKKYTEDDLRQQFAPFGEITSAIIMRDADGSSRCFEFVNYKRSECSIEAIKNLKMSNDLIMYVGRAKKKKKKDKMSSRPNFNAR
jgi:polyadenylate-binding protein